MFKVDRKSAAKTLSTGSGLRTSGVYDVIIKAVVIDKSKSNFVSASFFVEHNGKDVMLYTNLGLENKDGTKNFGFDIFNRLMVIADIDGGDLTEATLPIGKNGADKDVMVFDSIQDLPVKIWLQEEYSVYDGKTRDKMVVKGFYREDGASSDEIINDTEIGVQLSKDEAYHSKVTYKDGLTAEDVEEWKSSGRTNTPSVSSTKPKQRFGSKFGKR
jgi:hypothetical protein